MFTPPDVAGARTPEDPAQRTSADADFLQAAAHANVKHTVASLFEQSEVLREMHDQRLIDVVGAMCNVESGAVEIQALELERFVA